MIRLKKLNGEEFILNSSLIEMITENPDTTILLTNGKLLIVQETSDEVVKRVMEFPRKVYGSIIGHMQTGGGSQE